MIALGNFDGVHLGHQAIIRHAGALAKQAKAPLAIMTFEPHPREFFARQAGNVAALRLCPLHEKLSLLQTLGAELVFLVRFTRPFAATSPAQFIEQTLACDLRARHIVTGYNFAFGKDRAGNTDLLTQEAKKMGFAYSAHPPVTDGQGEPVSSSRIRHKLSQGDVAGAARQLGRAYAISGRVRHGDRRGRTLGFPTANIALTHLHAPRFGVYAIRSRLGEKTLAGVANIGLRPTFNGTTPLLEAHFFNLAQDIYGERLHIELVEFLRPEQRFESIDALKARIAADCAQAKERLGWGAS